MLLLFTAFLSLFKLGGGGRGEALDTTQDLNLLLLTNDCIYIFLLPDVSSNLPRNNLVLSGLGS